jgi:ketosteroid isomerase-like protein
MLVAALLIAAQLSPFDQVVASERAFAAASLEKGVHEAFLMNLAPDAIAFLPLPGPARPAHEGKPKTSVKLSWGPTWVAVSSAGDLALSTGPWQVKHNEKTLIKVSTGWFFSVWRRQPDGVWKVVVDAGIASPVTFDLPQTVENGFNGTPAATPSAGGAAKARSGVTEAERAVSAAATAGLGKAITAQADPHIRVYREGKAAAFGSTAANALLSGDTRKVSCTADDVVTSASGDLGYAYGTCVGEGGESPSKHGFLRVWRMQADGAWKILADVTP